MINFPRSISDVTFCVSDRWYSLCQLITLLCRNPNFIISNVYLFFDAQEVIKFRAIKANDSYNTDNVPCRFSRDPLAPLQRFLSFKNDYSWCKIVHAHMDIYFVTRVYSPAKLGTLVEIHQAMNVTEKLLTDITCYSRVTILRKWKKRTIVTPLKTAPH